MSKEVGVKIVLDDDMPAEYAQIEVTIQQTVWYMPIICKETDPVFQLLEQWTVYMERWVNEKKTEQGTKMPSFIEYCHVQPNTDICINADANNGWILFSFHINEFTISSRAVFSVPPSDLALQLRRCLTDIQDSMSHAQNVLQNVN